MGGGIVVDAAHFRDVTCEAVRRDAGHQSATPPPSPQFD
jgi:hypothetical protein